MDATENKETLSQLKHLMAENESLKEQLEEYKFVLDTRDQQVTALKAKTAEVSQLRSSLDTQFDELQHMQEYIGGLQQQVEDPSEREMGLGRQAYNSVSIEHQLADIKQKYTYLQTQLADLQTQILDLGNRNLLLQQHASRMAELESLLMNAEMERDEWMNEAKRKEEN